MHSVLSRFLRKLELSAESPPSAEQWQQFLTRVDAACVEADQSRYTLERSLQLVSDEMQELYRLQRESFEARQQAILNALPDQLFLLDEDGRYLEAMAGTTVDPGYAAADLVGSMVSEVLPADLASHFLSIIRATVDRREMQMVEYNLALPAGTRHFEGRVVPADLVVNGRRSVVFLARDITELHDSRQELTYAATHDSLTGLANRALFSERLGQAISKNLRTGRTGAVLFLDLDRFKTVNDTLGHSVGDALLREAALRLGRICRKEDVLARLGGDEFAILLDEIEEESYAERVGEKLLATFQQPFALLGAEVVSSTSIGICLFPKFGRTAEETLMRADTAMYGAKEAGRAGYRMFCMELERGAVETFSMQTDLRRAVGRGELHLVWQPRLHLGENRLTGFEALVRWQHPQRGLVPPDQFIPFAEQRGLIDEIGLWVFESVCRHAAAWHAAGHRFDHLSFNISQRQLANPELVTRMAGILGRTGADPRYLECEVTESAIIEQSELAQRSLRALSEMGIRLAIDDFGTGHSSLINLKRYPISRIKIDRAFVRDVGKDPYDEAIIRATLGIARGLGMSVTAEGIETAEQAAFLVGLGCEEGQGYYYGRPAPTADAETMLRQLHIAVPAPPPGVDIN